MGRPARIFTEEETLGIIDLYQNNTSIIDITKKYKTRKESIKKILKNNGVYKKRNYELYNDSGLVINQKYLINKDYFVNIDSPDKSYWLGFIFADGNVSNRKHSRTLTITLQHNDILHLEKFLKSINSNHPIKTVIHGNFKYCSIAITNTKICEDLIKLGCVPKKSLILEPPNINDDYIYDFIRGYFDADGCFAFYDKGNTILFDCYFLGTYNMMQFIKSKLEYKNIIVSDIKQVDKIFKIRIGKRNNLKAFYELLYNNNNNNNNNCFLDRKFNKINTYLKQVKLLK